MSMYELYKEVPALGYAADSNFGGLEVLEIKQGIDEKVVACFNYGTGRKDVRTHKIHYTSDGRCYFRKRGHRYYMDEIMRAM